MELKLIPIPPDKLKAIFGDIPQTKLGKEVSAEVLKLREDLNNMKVGSALQIVKGNSVEVETTQLKNGKRVGTGKMVTKYPTLTKYQTSVKFVNDRAKDGSKLYIFSDKKDGHYVVKVSSEDLKNKKYHASVAGSNRFSITKWRKANS
jgi:hypothetical protein